MYKPVAFYIANIATSLLAGVSLILSMITFNRLSSRKESKKDKKFMHIVNCGCAVLLVSNCLCFLWMLSRLVGCLSQ